MIITMTPHFDDKIEREKNIFFIAYEAFFVEKCSRTQKI